MPRQPYGTSFAASLTDSTRVWKVPPLNKTQVVISLRHDIGHFYVSYNDWDGTQWKHRVGSGLSCGDSERFALIQAEKMWVEEVVNQAAASTVPQKPAPKPRARKPDPAPIPEDLPLGDNDTTELISG